MRSAWSPHCAPPASKPATTCGSASTSSSCTPRGSWDSGGGAELPGEEGDYRRLHLLRRVPHRPVAAFLEEDDLGVGERLPLLLGVLHLDVGVMGAPDDQRRPIQLAQRRPQGF